MLIWFWFYLALLLYSIPRIDFTLTIDLNMSSLEFWLSLFAVFFAWFVAFPASIIILDFDLAIIPERLVYSPGYQRAWTFNPTNPIKITVIADQPASPTASMNPSYKLSSDWAKDITPIMLREPNIRAMNVEDQRY